MTPSTTLTDLLNRKVLEMDSHFSDDASSNLQRFAQNSTLERVEWAITTEIGHHLPIRSRAILAVIGSLIRLGYTGFGGHISALARCVERLYGACSARTIYRHLSAIESEGFICRTKYRTGPNRFRTVVEFNLPALSYWAGKRYDNVIPCKSVSSVLTKVQKDLGTITNHRVNSCNLSNKYNQPRAEEARRRARDRIDGKKHRHKTNPIILTLKILTWKYHRIDRHEWDWLRRRAEWELSAGDSLVSGHSGIPWPDWERRWTEMSIAERERAAMTEIVPLLRSRSALDISDPVPVQNHQERSPIPDGFPSSPYFQTTHDESNGPSKAGRPIQKPDLDKIRGNLGEEAFRVLCRAQKQCQERGREQNQPGLIPRAI